MPEKHLCCPGLLGIVSSSSCRSSFAAADKGICAICTVHPEWCGHNEEQSKRYFDIDWPTSTHPTLLSDFFNSNIHIQSSRYSQISSTQLLPDRRIPKTSEILPHDLAIALTLLEGDKYKSILPIDYIAHLRQHPGPNNVESACAVNNKIGYWVKKSILHYNQPEKRGKVLKFFVNTAQVNLIHYTTSVVVENLLLFLRNVTNFATSHQCLQLLMRSNPLS
jgi:hypothetical protein